MTRADLLLAAVESMPYWPAPLPGETLDHFCSITLPLHREAMGQWERDVRALEGEVVGEGD